MTKPQEKPETERNEKIQELYATGSYTKVSLARIFKISKQRVHQILTNNRCPKCGEPVKGEGLCPKCI